MFDTSMFMQTFEAHGMADRAVRASAPTGPGFIVGFQRPEDLILGGDVHTANIEVEYTTADAPDLAAGEGLTIKGVAYRVRNKPRTTGDGTFSRAELEVTRA